MGGQARGVDESRRAVQHRVERGVDIVKIMVHNLGLHLRGRGRGETGWVHRRPGAIITNDNGPALRAAAVPVDGQVLASPDVADALLAGAGGKSVSISDVEVNLVPAASGAGSGRIRAGPP
jgi:hypothetical protein